MGYNVECPICGTFNKNVDLNETNGWMECSCCGQLTRSTSFREFRFPWFPEKEQRAVLIRGRFNGEDNNSRSMSLLQKQEAF